MMFYQTMTVGTLVVDPSLRPSLTKIITEPPPIEPKFVWLGLEYLDNSDNAVKDGFLQIRELLGDKIETVDAKEATKKLIAAHKTIHEYQLLENLAPINQENPGKMNRLILEALEEQNQLPLLILIWH